MPDTIPDLTIIETLLSQANEEAANALQDIEATTQTKEVRKAARRALFRLGERGVRPSVKIAPVLAVKESIRPSGASRAFVSICDGAGNQMVFFEIPDLDGGYPTLFQLLINDLEGIKDLGTERMPTQKLRTALAQVEAALDSGLAVAEVEIGYARWLVEKARELGSLAGKKSPPGFLEWMEKVGGEAPGTKASPIPARVSSEEIRSDATISHDPEDFFELVWFEPWFFAVEEVYRWMQRWIEGELDVVPEEQEAVSARREELIEEATGFLFLGMRERYVSRLESAADVLFRRERAQGARMVLWHALDLQEQKPIHEVAFARAIVQRTFAAASMPMDIGGGSGEESETPEEAMVQP